MSLRDLVPKILETKTKEQAAQLLLSKIPDTDKQKVRFAIDFATSAHFGQYRKSGVEYVVHPILVACIVHHIGGDVYMIISALLHDVVEDTGVSITDIESHFGKEVKDLVDGLTKIDKIREENLISSSQIDERLIKSAMSFRKMLLSSIDNIKILVIKLCDRTHNVLTLDALPLNKQRRIAEETLVVYSPIAHRLGISAIKNILEDICFYYIFPDDYAKIDKYLSQKEQKLELKLNSMISDIETLMLKNGYAETDYEIHSRVKHKYSIYLKMQRKGVSIDEVLDLLAIRIIVPSDLDCYKVLGLIHTNFKPLISRFKDYVSVPKDNGYQTIHTTVFNRDDLLEVQIRTKKMDYTAELGVAAHWKYKDSGLLPKVSWLKGIEKDSIQDVEFYTSAKGELSNIEIAVYTPLGDIISLPEGSTALDFAYAVHSEVGQKAKSCFINRKPQPLLTKLQKGDLVNIVVGNDVIPRCTWLRAVKTVRARGHIRQACNQRLREINTLIGKSVLASYFMINHKRVEKFIQKENIGELMQRIPYNKGLLNEIAAKYKKKLFLIRPPFEFFKQRDYEFDNLIITSNKNISEAHFDHCCRPKYGDEIMAIVYKKGKVIIHHKQCERGFELLKNSANALLVKWAGVNNVVMSLTVLLDHIKGSLAEFVGFLAANGVNVINMNIRGDQLEVMSRCEVLAEFPNKTVAKTKEKLQARYNVLEIVEAKDPYKE
ncbi:MAG: RelA/SpoT family protein [Helicobacteraceae bacterium]